MRKFSQILLLPVAAIILNSCSSSVDTSQFNSDQYYEYALKLYNDEDYEKALSEFQTILLQFPGSVVNDDAEYYLAMTYYKREQFLLAAYEFSKLIRNLPASPYVADAQFMLADCYYRLSPSYELDQTYTKKAVEEFQAFIDFFPTNSKVTDAEKKIKELNEKLAEKEYHSALIYEKMEYYEAAIDYYGRVSDTYHDSKYGSMALYNRIQVELKLNLKNKALTDISIFLARYPDDERAPELKEIETGISMK